MNANRTAMGMVNVGIKALEGCQRNRKTTRTTVTMTSINVDRRLSMARWIKSERS